MVSATTAPPVRPRPARPGPLVTALRLSLDADREATIWTLVIFAIRPSLSVVTMYLVRVVIDGFVRHSAAETAWAVAAAAVTAAISAGSVTPAVELSIRMIEATAAEVDRRLMRMLSAPRSIAHLDEPEILDRVEALAQDRVRLSEGVDSISLVLGATVRATITVVLLASVDWWLLLCPLLAVPSVLATRRGQRRRAAAVDASATDARLSRHLYRIGVAPEAGKEIRLFGLLPMLLSRHERAAAAADQKVVRAMGRGLVSLTLAAGVFALGYVGALVLVMWRLAGGAASLGDVVLTLGLVTSISLQMSDIARYWAFALQIAAATRRMTQLTDRLTDVSDAGRGTSPAPARLADGITLADVGFCYPGSSRWAVRHIDLHLPAGATVVLVGDNGAGKSTLVKLLTGLYRPVEGTVTVEGMDLADIAPTSWYARTSACFQDFVRMEFTVATGVGIGDLPRLDDVAAIDEAIRAGAAAEVVRALPDGRDTRVGRSYPDGTELSGGQWQRLALARARMRAAPCLVVLDEPTAAIDPLAEDQLLRGYLAAAREVLGAARGITVVVSHRLSTARTADLVVVVDAGGITERGTHEDLVAAGGEYARMYLEQQRAYS